MKTQRGVSLVELMVAITLGLLLLLGLGEIFSSINQTSHLRQGLSALQNNERMAMTFLGAGIRNAGYYPNTLSGVAPAAPVLGTGSGTGGADTLSVSFFAASGVAANQGCSTLLTAGASYTDTLSVSSPGTSAGLLQCAETTAGVTTNIPLVAGVQGMSVVYGVDPGCTGSVTKYLSATQVPAAVWAGTCTAPLGTQLKTVSTTLIFTNPLAGQAGQPLTVTLTQTMPYMNGL